MYSKGGNTEGSEKIATNCKTEGPHTGLKKLYWIEPSGARNTSQAVRLEFQCVYSELYNLLRNTSLKKPTGNNWMESLTVNKNHPLRSKLMVQAMEF